MSIRIERVSGAVLVVADIGREASVVKPMGGWRASPFGLTSTLGVVPPPATIKVVTVDNEATSLTVRFVLLNDQVVALTLRTAALRC